MKWMLQAGSYRYPVEVKEDDNYYYLAFDYNPALLAEVKVLEGATWMGQPKYNNVKQWRINKSKRNDFRLSFMQGGNPYAWYDQPLKEPAQVLRPLFNHQLDLVRTGITYRQCIWAAEMGTGKTLAAITVMELSNSFDWFWVGSKSALRAVQLEFKKWNAQVVPLFMTYERLVTVLQNWERGRPPPKNIVVDEAQRIKTPSARRSQAMKFLADSMREEHGEEAHIILMSGAPAPRSPTDWWHLCEVACPGFLREGNLQALHRRLAILTKEDYGMGQFNKHKTWLDDERKCAVCGDPEINHTSDHPWTKSKNEVALLYRRTKGLVTVKLKKDCLDLPDMVFQRVIIKPNRATLNAYNALKRMSKTAIEALTLARELSDGFQYQDVESGSEPCETCRGTGSIDKAVDPENPNTVSETEVQCRTCKGTKRTKTFARSTVEVPCPKEAQLKEDLDFYEDVGRVVIYSGFTGSIERCVRIVTEQKWDFIKADGKGWRSSLPGGELEWLEQFQNQSLDKRIAFIGHPDSAGEGLNLTASPVIIYYSNGFNGNGRIQSQARIHRPGMDYNRGATIRDYLHLPSDLLVLENLLKKLDLQAMSMGAFEQELKDAGDKFEREQQLVDAIDSEINPRAGTKF